MRRVLGLLGVMLASASPVAAACDGPAPSFRTEVRRADTIVVGEVTATGAVDVARNLARFTLRVDHVLRGSADPTIDFDGLVMHPCAGVLRPRSGDVIAVAFGDRQMATNAVAYVRGDPHRPDIDRMSLPEVYAAAGVPMPAGSTEPPSPQWILVAFGVAAAMAAVGIFYRAGRIRRSESP